MMDVVTLGETMIRLSPKPYLRLEQANELEFKIGGTESNVAIALVRLGLKTAWISKLVNNALGRRLANEIREQGVDISRVVWTAKGRVGVYFIEFGSAPRPSVIIYDRKDSAINTLSEEEVDWEFFTHTRLIHLTGITPALSDNCRKLVWRAIREAKKEKILLSFDVNYRAKLWSPQEARSVLEEMVKEVDILITSSTDAQLVFGLEGSPEEVTKGFKERYGNSIVVLTLGADGALALADRFYRGKVVKATVEVDRVGAGDAFDAGFLYGYLANDIEKGLSFGNILSSLKYSIPGDLALITKEEVEELLEREDTSIRR